jgi:chemosensory pili system protein ChpC
MADTQEDIYCLIVPMRDKPILIPNKALAEIVPYIDSEPAPEDHQPWHIGYLHWRGMLLPVVSYERIYNPDFPDAERRQKMVAILHTQLGLKQMPYFGIAVEGIPRLAPVSRESIDHRDSEHINDLHDSILADVVYKGRELLIPDIKTVEWLIEKHIKK